MQHLKKAVSTRASPMIINYRMNAGYQPSNSWVHGPEGGGRNRGEACHIYDLFTFFTGGKAVEIDYTAIRSTADYYRSDDNFVCTIRFDDGSIGTLTYTALGAREFPKEQMQIYCEGWIASMDNYKSVEVVGRKMRGIKNRRIEKGHREQMTAFARAILSGGNWPIQLWEMLQATRISFCGLI